ncbi:MAG: hypothetical protein R8G01_20270 [Ilumatobacteraceae bacterium]|nr:hypothetical protein [Ilumatobacteraceae bacterium]
MKKHTRSIALVTGLTLAACGGGGSDQDQVADMLIEAADDAGASPDSDCIRDLAQDISDDDAEAMADAGLQGDPEISDAAGEILAEMLLC